MFSSSSFRVGRAAFAAIRRPNPTLFAASRASKSTAAGTSNPRSSAKWIETLKGSPALKVAVGVSGLLFVCGLDCVAPTTYPFQDGAASTKAKTYWNDSDANPQKQKQLSNSDRSSSAIVPLASNNGGKYKVVIVGGGMAGLHTALALSERMKRETAGAAEILIVDANKIGESSSGRSKGLAVPGLQVPEEDLANICGSKKLAKHIYDLTYEAARRLKEDIVQRYAIDCNWVDSGHVEASLHIEEDHAEEEEGDEDKCRALTASQVRHLLGQPDSSTMYKQGEFDPSCYGVDPLALTLGLAHVLEHKWGVQIQEQTKVSKIERILPNSNEETSSQDSMKYELTTQSGAKIECQHVVLCTGPELVSKELSQRLKHAIIPIYTWMASTAPLGESCPLQDGVVEELDNNITTEPTTTKKSPAPMCGDDYVCLNYWRRTDDGRILFGSLADAYPVPRWVAAYRLRQAFRQVYPQLADVPFEHVWGGRLAFSRDSVPLIGRDEAFDHVSDAKDPSKSGVWYATGFGGHGIIPTVMAGSILADAITGTDNNTWRLFQRQFPPKYTFWPVSQMGAQALLTLYNAFDWLHVKGVPVPKLPKPW